MKSFDISSLVRPHLKDLVPYSSARDDFKGKANVYLDANENPFNTGLNRYPDPHQVELKQTLSTIKNIPVQNFFIGNGSDEVIDLIFRAFCEPGVDNIVLLPPTYGMYKVSAKINNVMVKLAPLDDRFDIDIEKTLSLIDAKTKAIFLCSPNNPTGNSLSQSAIKILLDKFSGLVVVDEAYIDFAAQPSLTLWVGEYKNLIVMQTLSKAWGLASARVGIGIADEAIIQLLNQIKPPYNISGPNQQMALTAIRQTQQASEKIAAIQQQRDWLAQELNKIHTLVFTVYPSDANFLLVKMGEAKAIYQYLSSEGIVVRDRSKELNCENCLRITVGTETENQLLIQKLKDYAKSIVH